MTDHFERAVAIIIDIEGGYVNHPDDPGGETKYGISKRSYPQEDIAGLTVERAKELYHRDFWKLAACEHLTWPMALYVFDFAVNSGPARARQMIADAPTPEDYLWRRAAFYTGLVRRRRKSLAFLAGWINRLAEIRHRGQ